MRILFIGNSITIHGICSYWPGEWGMAASDKKKDYVHCVISSLHQAGIEADHEAVNFFQWEVMAHDRSETYPLLKTERDESYTHVIVQLGENITDATTLFDDFVDLLRYLQKRFTNAVFLVLGSFFEQKAVDDIKEKVCAQMGMTFISFHDISGKKDYMAGGKINVQAGSEKYCIEHGGVALHPNDRAMEIYADRIMKAWRRHGMLNESEVASGEINNTAWQDGRNLACMHKTSIVILSYNTYEITKGCIESIRRFTAAGNYELIVVDNASKDASVAWLKRQKDVKLIINKENKGFPGGCNQGMAVAEPGNDILLLNSDTIVTPNWLENLQKALYSAENIGAVSCVTNCCSNFQQIQVSYSNYDELVQFAENFNHSNPALWEIRPRLIGFCYLIKNAAYQQVGLLDERFAPGNFEDDDYSLRLIMAGYKLLLCQDTFIHHYGSASFTKHCTPEEQAEKTRKFNELLAANQKKISEKWQVSENYGCIHNVIFDVELPDDAQKRIFIAGCNGGMDICYLQSKYPQACISGATENWAEAAIAGKYLDVSYCPDTEKDVFILLTGQYDYILLADKNKQYEDFDGYVNKLMPYLSEAGSIHISE